MSDDLKNRGAQDRNRISQLSLIKSFADDPAGAWAAQSAEYAGKTSQDMATLLIELFGMRLQANASLVEAKKHFESMIDLNLRLKEIDSDRALGDLVMGVLMCMSLQTTWNKFDIGERIRKPFKGESGAKIYINADNGAEKIIAEDKGKEGETIRLTIDAELQKDIYQQFNNEAGSAAAIDPKTGKHWHSYQARPLIRINMYRDVKLRTKST